MKRSAFAAAAVISALTLLLGGCTMKFSPGASALLNNHLLTESTGTYSVSATAGASNTAASATSVNTTEPGNGETGVNTTGEENSTGQSMGTQTVTPQNFKCKELDILTSGTFFVDCIRYDETGAGTAMKLANTPSTVYMVMNVSGAPVGILMSGGKMYMMYEPKSIYMELNDVVLKLIGLNTDELNFESIGSMPGVVPDKCEETDYTDGKKATRATYNDGSSTVEIITRGDRLLEMNTITDGKKVNSLVFSSVSGDVPQEKRSVPSYFDKANLVTFFRALSGDMTQ